MVVGAFCEEAFNHYKQRKEPGNFIPKLSSPAVFRCFQLIYTAYVKLTGICI